MLWEEESPLAVVQQLSWQGCKPKVAAHLTQLTLFDPYLALILWYPMDNIASIKWWRFAYQCQI